MRGALPGCPVWGPVLEKAFGSPAVEIDAAALAAEDARVMRTRHLPWMLASRLVGDRLLHRLDALPGALTAVYRSIQEVTGAELIVDTSKPPSFGYLLQHLDDIDLRILHVVRDPRAVALLVDPDEGPEPMAASGPRCSASRPRRARCSGTSGTAPPAGCGAGSDRYLRMRYEDLANDPQHHAGPHDGLRRRVPPRAAVHRRPTRSPPRPSTRSPATRTGCAAARYRSPRRRVEGQLPPARRRLVSALTAPLLARYGYRPASS